MKEKEIIYENGRAWVFEDRKNQCYTVFLSGITHSISDSSYHLNEDGLGIAKARCDFFAKRDRTQSTNRR